MPPCLERGRFLGQVLRVQRFPGFMMAEVVYPAAKSLPVHSHESAYFCLILSGNYDERYGRRSRACKPMTFAFHPIGERHAETFDGTNVSSFNVEFDDAWIRGHLELASSLDQALECHQGPIAAMALRLWKEFDASDSDPSYLEGLATEIIASIHQDPRSCLNRGRAPSWVPIVLNTLATRFPEPLALRSVA